MGNIIKTIINYFLRTIGHPVTLISIFGPFFLVININWLQVLVRVEQITALDELLQNDWSFCMTDYYLQLYTLMVVVIIYYLDVVQHLYKMVDSGHLQEIKDDSGQLAFLGLSVAILLAGIIATTVGLFGQPDVVKMYYPTQEEAWGTWRWPPLQSPITIARGAMILLGIWLSYWKYSTRDYVK